MTGSVPNGTYLLVRKGPITDADYNWYEVTDDADGDNVNEAKITGWVAADFLVVEPPVLDLPPDAYTFGTNIQVSSSYYLRSKPSTSGSVVATVPGVCYQIGNMVSAAPQLRYLRATDGSTCP